MSSDAETQLRTVSQQNTPLQPSGVRRTLSPLRCRIWAQHSRPDEHLTDDACKTLRESIDKNGQHQPALGRPVSDDPDYDVEIVCGARRHAVTLALRRSLIVEVRHMTDAEAYVAMYEENYIRESDSPYVRGQILSRALRSGTYPSQESLASAFNISLSAVSRLLMIARLPSVVVAAFQSADDIREAWGIELYKLWRNEQRRESIAARARELANKTPRPPAREAYATLITAPGGRVKGYRTNRKIPIRGTSNVILFHEQDYLESVTYIIPKAIMSPNRRDALKQSLIRFLEEELMNSVAECTGKETRLSANGLSTTAQLGARSKPAAALLLYAPRSGP